MQQPAAVSANRDVRFAAVHAVFIAIWLVYIALLLTGHNVVLPGKGNAVVLSGDGAPGMFAVAGFLSYGVGSAMMVYVHLTRHDQWEKWWKLFVVITVAGIALIVYAGMNVA